MTPADKPKHPEMSWTDINPENVSIMKEIQQMLNVLQTIDSYLNCTANELRLVKNQLQTLRKGKETALVTVNSELTDRNEAIKPKLLQLKQHVDGLVRYCRPKWGVYLELSATDDFPLSEPIRLLVDDPELDPALKNTMTLNHGIAALVLQLAINITIESPFLIVDGLDKFVEPCLIAYVQLQLLFFVYIGHL